MAKIRIAAYCLMLNSDIGCSGLGRMAGVPRRSAGSWPPMPNAGMLITRRRAQVRVIEDDLKSFPVQADEHTLSILSDRQKCHRGVLRHGALTLCWRSTRIASSGPVRRVGLH